MKPLWYWCAAAVTLLLTGAAPAQLPVGGRPAQGMAAFDTIMRNFMVTNNIAAGVLGIGRNGRIEYLRSFGWLFPPIPALFPGVPLPENAMMRTASVVKPVTAAAIRHFDAAGGLGAAGLNRRAFNVGVNGLLIIPPSPALGDARYADITVEHLLLHQGGFNRERSPFDVMFRSRDIAAALGVNSPPSNFDMMRYMLGQPLYWNPGPSVVTTPRIGNITSSANTAARITITTATAHHLQAGDLVTIAGHSLTHVNGTKSVLTVPSGNQFTIQGIGLPQSNPGLNGTWKNHADNYSNFGYMVLGEILQAYTSEGYLGYVHKHVMRPELWIPSTEFAVARSLVPDRHLREPHYLSANTAWSVFDNNPPIDVVPMPDGGFFIEGMLAHGGVIASAQALIRFANAYHVSGYDGDIGKPITDTNRMRNNVHSGRLDGTNTWLQQRADGIVFYLALNRADLRDPDLADRLAGDINAQLGRPTEFTWPGVDADGFWVTLGAEQPATGFGSYDSPYRGFQSALNRVTDGSHLRLRPGSQNWTGTIGKRLRLDAPEGGAVHLGTP